MAHSKTETVAVLGAGGTMGLPMARNIARAGLAVRAWNRSRDKAEALVADGLHGGPEITQICVISGDCVRCWHANRW